MSEKPKQHPQAEEIATLDVKDTRAARQRKPYTAPLILSREPLEAMANVCSPPFGKADFAACQGPLFS